MLNRLTLKHTLLAVACGAALTSLSAQADTVRIDSFAFPPALSFTLTGSGGVSSASAGELQGLLNGNSFLTYCADLVQSFNWGVTYSDFTPVSATSMFGATKANDLGRLFTGFQGAVIDPTTSAAFQLSAWEIMKESTSAYSLSSGSFTASGSSAAIAQGNSWLSTLPTQSLYNVSVLYSPTKQDFLVTAPIPEPSTYATLSLGLGLLGFVAHRRRQRGQA